MSLDLSSISLPWLTFLPLSFPRRWGTGLLEKRMVHLGWMLLRGQARWLLKDVHWLVHRDTPDGTLVGESRCIWRGLSGEKEASERRQQIEILWAFGEKGGEIESSVVGREGDLKILERKEKVRMDGVSWVWWWEVEEAACDGFWFSPWDRVCDTWLGRGLAVEVREGWRRLKGWLWDAVEQVPQRNTLLFPGSVKVQMKWWPYLGWSQCAQLVAAFGSAQLPWFRRGERTGQQGSASSGKH